MVDFIFVIFFLLSAYNVKIKGLNDFFQDHMDLENTYSIKGIFVWLIIFCHKNNYDNLKKYFFFKIIRNIKVVPIFFFYSGFGIYESIKAKGIYYVKTLPIKSAILFIKFQLIVLLFLITNILILGQKIGLKNYLLSVIFKSSIGNSNWFAFTIIVFYLYSYVSFIHFTYKFYLGIIVLSFLCFLHFIFVYDYFYPKCFYSVETILCFLTGFCYSLCQKYIDKIIKNSDIYYFGIMSITIYLFYTTLNKYTLLKILLKSDLFAILVVLLTMKIKFNNDFLKFLNSHSYSIYLLQRLIMGIICKKRIFQNYNFIKMSFEFTSIFFISSIFDKYTFFVDKLFKRNLNKNQNNKYIIISNININNMNKKIITIDNKKIS